MTIVKFSIQNTKQHSGCVFQAELITCNGSSPRQLATLSKRTGGIACVQLSTRNHKEGGRKKLSSAITVLNLMLFYLSVTLSLPSTPSLSLSSFIPLLISRSTKSEALFDPWANQHSFHLSHRRERPCPERVKEKKKGGVVLGIVSV